MNDLKEDCSFFLLSIMNKGFLVFLDQKYHV